MKKSYVFLAIALIIVVGGYTLLNNGQSSSLSKQTPLKDETSSPAISARYVDYTEENFTKATENNGKTVLFFAALAWCPSCQAADKDIKANFSKIPQDVTILRVDYDTAKDLKQKYAITMQDTFVQVDAQGKEVTRWNSGGQGVNALFANIK